MTEASDSPRPEETAEEGESSPPRPVPVRELMPASVPAAPFETAQPAPIEAAPPTPPRFHSTPEGRWEVVEAGATRTGFGTDSGAILLRLEFSPEPPASGPVRSVVVVALSLDQLSEDALSEAFDRSRSVSK